MAKGNFGDPRSFLSGQRIRSRCESKKVHKSLENLTVSAAQTNNLVKYGQYETFELPKDCSVPRESFLLKVYIVSCFAPFF